MSPGRFWPDPARCLWFRFRGAGSGSPGVGPGGWFSLSPPRPAPGGKVPSVRHTLGSLWRPGSSWGRGRERASLLSPVDGGQGSEAVSSGSAEAGGRAPGFPVARGRDPTVCPQGRHLAAPAGKHQSTKGRNCPVYCPTLVKLNGDTRRRGVGKPTCYFCN